MEINGKKILFIFWIAWIIYYFIICFIMWTFNILNASTEAKLWMMLIWLLANFFAFALIVDYKPKCCYPPKRDLNLENNKIMNNNLYLEKQLQLLKKADDLLKQTNPAILKIKKQLT